MQEGAVNDATGYLAALAGLSGLGPRRLGLLLAAHEPRRAWEAICGKGALAPSVRQVFGPALLAKLRSDSASIDPLERAATCQRLGISVLGPGSQGYPGQFLVDPAPPAVLFTRGDPGLVERRCVAVIGTRHPTRAGLDTAAELGAGLAQAGVVVVSGLARGIDGAAHRGALEVGRNVIGIVGNGLDRPYPRQHASLWQEVGERGLLLSEWPPATAPDAFRFPLRNRLIAALSEIVVVVESRETGGSMSTVTEALARGVDVMAVPGSVRIRAAAGTNQLIRDGAAPVTSVEDILDVLGLSSGRGSGLSRDRRPPPDEIGARVLEICAVEPRTLADLVEALHLDLSQVALAVARLERDGWVIETGGWFQVGGPWAGLP